MVSVELHHEIELRYWVSRIEFSVQTIVASPFPRPI